MRKWPIVAALVLAVAVLAGPATRAGAAGPIPAGSQPYAVLANPMDHEIYVANIFSDNVTVIDSTNDTVLTTITVAPPTPGGISAPVGLAHNPNTNKLYIVNFWSGQLLTVDIPTHSIEGTVSIGYGHIDPRAVVVNPNTNLVYMTSLGQSAVYAIGGDPAQSNYNQIIAKIGVGSYPRSLAVNTNLNRLYVANTSSGSVSVIDIDPLSARYNTVIASLYVGGEPYAMALNHATAKLYVANRSSNFVSVIDCITNTLLRTVGVGSYPRAIDVNPETNRVYVANRDSNTVTVLDGVTDNIARTITAGVKPYAVASIKTLTGNTYVANYGSTGTSGTVTGISPSFATSETTVGLGPSSLSIDTLLAKPKVFVGNYSSNDVSVIDPEVGASSLVTHIDPLPNDTAPVPTPLITGTSASLAKPFAKRIMKVYYLLDSSNGKWKEARITSGRGTPSVSWEAQVTQPLTPGQHTIRVFALDMTGATVTSSDGSAVAVPYTGQVAAYDFRVEENKLGRLEGIVFDDANANGRRDDGEPLVAGVPVAVTLPDGTIRATSSNGDGVYTFDKLAAGPYGLDCPVADGWRATTATTATIDLPAGETRGADFGRIRLGSISGAVFDDSNGDGVRGTGEAGLAGWPIALTGTAINGESVKMTAKADDGGAFSFEGLLPGDYALEQPLPTLVTAPDGSVIEAGWAHTHAPSPIALPEGAVVITGGFGNIQQGWITGTVTDEYTGEVGAGVSITLVDSGQTALTDGVGRYFFYGLVPSGTALHPAPVYALLIAPPDGYLTHGDGNGSAVVSEGSGSACSFTIYRASWSAGTKPRAAAFWRNWKRGCTEADMARYLDSAKRASGRFDGLTPAGVHDFLSRWGKKPLARKLEGQLLVAWLNVVSGRLGLDVNVRVDGVKGVSKALGTDAKTMRVEQVLRATDRRLASGHGPEKDLIVLRKLLSRLNRGRLF